MVKVGGYNSAHINKQLSPAQNTPALHATPDSKIAEKRDLVEPSRVRGSYFASQKSLVVSRFKFKEEKKSIYPKNLKVRLSVDITEFLPSPHAFPRLTSEKCKCLETSDKGERGMMGTSTERGE